MSWVSHFSQSSACSALSLPQAHRLTSHALDSQNKRGGRVKLQPLTAPETEYDHPEKGDALYAMELTLSLEVRLDFRDAC